MTALQTNFVSIACDGPDCTTEPVTFLATPEGKAEASRLNPWLEKTQRVVGLPNGAQLTYCSDTCEAKALAAGNHNIQEPKRVILGDVAQAQLAAQAQARAAQATAALKAGQPVNLS